MKGALINRDNVIYKSEENKIEVLGVDWELYYTTDKRKQKAFLGFNKKSLNQIFDVANGALLNWGEIIVIRFDLTFSANLVMNDYLESNKPITELRAKLERKLMSSKGYKLKKGQMGFCWSREQESSSNHHYHCFAILNEKLVNSSRKVNLIISELWKEYGVAQTHKLAKKVKRGDYQKQRELIKNLSYLAKETSTGNKAKGIRCFAVSHVKRKAEIKLNHYGLHNKNKVFKSDSKNTALINSEIDNPMKPNRLQRQLAITKKISAQLAVIERCAK